MTVRASLSRFLLSLMPWIFCGGMAFIVACQPNEHTSTGPTETSGGGGNTGDGGGGTGFNSKMYEQYITKLETLGIWKTEISKILERASSFNMSLLNVLQKKTWIFVPQKLNRIDAEKMGMEFRTKDYEQYAFQTEGEVWIDTTAFTSLAPETQAYLIFHETIMDLYVLSKVRQMGDKNPEDFAPLKKAYCTRVKDLFPEPQFCADSVTVAAKPKSLYSVLTAADYPKIREATHLLMDSASEKNSDEILVSLIGLGFDERVVGSALRTSPAEDNGAKDLKNLIGWIEYKSIDESCVTKDPATNQEQKQKCSLSLSADKKAIIIKNNDSSFHFPLPGPEKGIGFQTRHLVTRESTVRFSYWAAQPEDESGWSTQIPHEILISYAATGSPVSVKFEANKGFTPERLWIFSKIFSIEPGIGFQL
ncbi:hypothetical protein QJS83_13395 [Bdellovibrio sp. 22V]|uniref:hypothetical protein n=1 Tax=Bdellovibrio sp. 22V TaxID=3044166 RepID=UPI002543E779|nr:hypothetical protein [Bdellovibrio sp. 22V]WII71458.1 hypothetical protein QJS83_13395 [Bdellovibrio sp. 22V]